MKTRIYSVLASLMLCGLLSAQVIIDGELRTRSEYSHGYASLASEDQDLSLFVTQRTRLNLKYKTDAFTTYLSLQDVRLWGSQSQLVGNEDQAASIHQAWAELRLFENASVKLGRQEVIYDNHRIFGNVGWAQQARSHDMAIFKYESDVKVHLALAYHQDADRTTDFYTGSDAYKALQMLWLKKNFGNLDASLMFLNNGVPYSEEIDSLGNMIDQSIKYSQTIGFRSDLKLDDLVLGGSFYYQGGKNAANSTLNAYELNFEGAYSLSEKFVLAAGYERLSGTSYTTSDENNSFTPFYGTNHKFNGFMDYFYVGNHANNVGLDDIYLKAKLTTGKFKLDGHLHFFSAAADIAEDADKYLGTELDLQLAYTISKQAKVMLGYSQMFGSDSMELIKGGDKSAMSNWAWLMLSFKPSFLNTTPPPAVAN